MKNIPTPIRILTFALLFTFASAHSQIDFEEVSGPVEFSMEFIAKSPTGEYFTQAHRDHWSLYNSSDGENWEKATLPANAAFTGMQFFSDGTPVFFSEYDELFIRREGIWHTMKIGSGHGLVSASDIHGDTLFVCQRNELAYSLDKGVTFTSMFTASEYITGHYTKLERFGNRFVVYHTAGASDHISVYSNSGEKLFYKELNLGITKVISSNCGEILVYDHSKFNIFLAEDLALYSGSLTSLGPGIKSGQEIFSDGDFYYFMDGNTLFRSPGCLLQWEVIAVNSAFESNELLWVNSVGDILVFNPQGGNFYESDGGGGNFLETEINIIYPFVMFIDEGSYGGQAVETATDISMKSVEEDSWGATGIGNEYTKAKVTFSPEGDLYIFTFDKLYYAENGVGALDTIPLPVVAEPFNLDWYEFYAFEEVLFLAGGLISNSSYYSTDNGMSWNEINALLPFFHGEVIAQKVNNTIVIADREFYREMIEIHLGTGEVKFYDLNFQAFLYSYSPTLLGNGQLYIYIDQFVPSEPSGLYTCAFGEPMQFLGDFPELEGAVLAGTSIDGLYAFGNTSYYYFNGIGFDQNYYTGLPQTGFRQFFLSANDYLYVTINRSQIFRSKRPLVEKHFISGNVIQDENLNCQYDAGDALLKSWKIQAENDTYLRIAHTDINGHYQFNLPEGEYTITATPPNDYYELCENDFSVTVDGANLMASRDFIAKPLLNCASPWLDISTPLLRRCFQNTYTVVLTNTGPYPLESPSIELIPDPSLIEFTSSHDFEVSGNGSLHFTIDDLDLGQSEIIKLYFKVSCEAEFGQEHCIQGIVSGANLCPGEAITYTECQMNIGSYDPNDKRAFNEKGRSAERVDKGDYVYYHIRFQNTGTDTAFNIQIIDTLSEYLDIYTIEMLSGSHPYTFEVTEGPVLTLNFDNIFLPDSSVNLLNSNGYVKFRIRAKSDMAYGTYIPNTASIYFDFNDPVLTNEVVVEIDMSSGVVHEQDLLSFSIFPNPASTKLSLILDDSFPEISHFYISDISGTKLGGLKRFLKDSPVDVSHLTPGVYFISLLKGDEIVAAGQFVKMENK